METKFMERKFREFLEENDYKHIRQINDQYWGAIYQFLYGWSIIIGKIGDTTGYEDRWDLTSYHGALLSLEQWEARGFDGEPDGWIRHLRTGRRRPDGDRSKEHINY